MKRRLHTCAACPSDECQIAAQHFIYLSNTRNIDKTSIFGLFSKESLKKSCRLHIEKGTGQSLGQTNTHKFHYHLILSTYYYVQHICKKKKLAKAKKRLKNTLAIECIYNTFF